MDGLYLSSAGYLFYKFSLVQTLIVDLFILSIGYIRWPRGERARFTPLAKERLKCRPNSDRLSWASFLSQCILRVVEGSPQDLGGSWEVWGKMGEIKGLGMGTGSLGKLRVMAGWKRKWSYWDWNTQSISPQSIVTEQLNFFPLSSFLLPKDNQSQVLGASSWKCFSYII